MSIVGNESTMGFTQVCSSVGMWLVPDNLLPPLYNVISLWHCPV